MAVPHAPTADAPYPTSSFSALVPTTTPVDQPHVVLLVQGHDELVALGA